MKLSEMRRLLEDGNIRLTRSLGQNFLHDGNQLRRIVTAAELNRTDTVLEIGPGLGPLTELLLAAAGGVLAIEKDQRLVEFLRQRFAQAISGSGVRPRVLTPVAPLNPCSQQSRAGLPPIPHEPSGPSEAGGGKPGRRDTCPTLGSIANDEAHALPLIPGSNPALDLIHADALEWLREHPSDWRAWKLVANLPYSVASPILVELAEAPQPPERMVVTLQIEVARRIMAEADTEDYGLLTLLLQLRYEPRGWFKIPASCFFPAPNVDSACVTLVRRPEPLLCPKDAATFTRIVKRSFSQRRKMMLKLLKQDWPAEPLRSGWVTAALSDSTRAESVRLDQFVTLTRCLAAAQGAAL